jgi:hypothetical protein
VTDRGTEPLFDCRNVAQAIIANRLMMLRRGNPSMSGPGPRDIQNAHELIRELESHGLTVTVLDA